MRNRYRLFRRCGGTFYAFDNETGKRESLLTKDKAQAAALLQCKNEAHQQPAMSLQKARIYLVEGDPTMPARTWQHVMGEILKSKQGKTRERYERAFQDKAFDLIRERTLLDTRAEHLLQVLAEGRVATNIFLRRIHNFALDFDWLARAIVPKHRWPPVRFKEKRAITLSEHQKIIEREANPERKAFYETCWHLGGSQSDVADLKAQDIDWQDQTIGFFRRKTGRVQMVHFGEQVAALLRRLPQDGLLFPKLAGIDEKHRTSLFQMACRRVGVKGVSLHSYRYAWAERARTAGMPERFAMENLGHNSKAVHRAYAKKAQVRIPSLEEYEKKIIPMPSAEAV
jgi:integrase